MKKLSIIIPIFNGGRYIENILNDIFNKTIEKLFEFEVILVNDGSTDNSAELCKKYEAKYKNIKFFNNSNHGVSYSRNYGIDHSEAEYIMFVDCDDRMSENWMEIINETFQKNKQYDVILYSNYFDENCEKIEKVEVLSYIYTFNKKNIRISGPYSKLFKNEFLNNNNIRFDENLINGEDFIFNIKSILACETYLLEKNSFYIIRHNPYSSTSNFYEKIIDSEIMFNEILEKCFSDYADEYKKINGQCLGFYISVRTLAYRISYLNNYFEARKYYKQVRSNKFFVNNFKKYKIKENIKLNVLYNLFKYKMYIVLYLLCKYKSKNIKNESYEKL